MADIIVNDTVAKNMDISQEATDADARAADAGVAADAGGADAEAAVLPAAKEKDSGDAASDVPRDREPTPKPVKRSRSRRSDTPAPTGKGMESLPAKTDKPPVKQRITSYPPAKKNTGPCRQDADNVEPVFNVPYPIEAPKSMSSRFRRYLKMRDTDTFLTNEQYETIVVGIRPQVEKLYTEAKPHPLPEQFPSRDIPASWKIEKLKVEFNSTDFDTLIFVTFAFMLFHLRPSDFAKVERYFKPFVCTSLKKKYVFNHNVLCIQEHIRKSFSRNPHIFIPRDSDDEVVQPVLLAPLSPDNKYKLMLINGWTTPYFYPFVVDVENIGYKRLIDMIIATYVTTPSYTTDDIKCKIVKRLVYAGTVYKWHLQCMVKDIDGCIKFNDYRNREAWITDGVIDGVAVEIIMSSIRVMLTSALFTQNVKRGYMQCFIEGCRHFYKYTSKEDLKMPLDINSRYMELRFMLPKMLQPDVKHNPHVFSKWPIALNRPKKEECEQMCRYMCHYQLDECREPEKQAIASEIRTKLFLQVILGVMNNSYANGGILLYSNDMYVISRLLSVLEDICSHISSTQTYYEKRVFFKHNLHTRQDHMYKMSIEPNRLYKLKPHVSGDKKKNILVLAFMYVNNDHELLRIHSYSKMSRSISCMGSTTDFNIILPICITHKPAENREFVDKYFDKLTFMSIAAAMHVPFVGDLTNAVMHSLDNVARLPVAMIGPYYSIHAHICTSSLVKETVPGKYECKLYDMQVPTPNPIYQATQSGPMYQLPPVPAFANHNYQCIRNMNVYLKTLEADPELQAYAQTIANGEVPPPPLPERIQPEPMLYDAANRPICVADPSTTQDDALMRDRIGRYIGINTAHARQAANMTFPINEPSSPPNDNFGIVETESTPMPYSIPTEPIYPYCIITEEAGTVNIDGPVHKKSKLSNSDVVVVSPLSTNSEFDSTTESVVDTPMCYLSPSSVVSPATNQDSSELFIDHDNVNIAVHDIELPPLEYTTSQDDSLLGEKKKKRKYTKRSK